MTTANNQTTLYDKALLHNSFSLSTLSNLSFPLPTYIYLHLHMHLIQSRQHLFDSPKSSLLNLHSLNYNINLYTLIIILLHSHTYVYMYAVTFTDD